MLTSINQMKKAMFVFVVVLFMERSTPCECKFNDILIMYMVY